MTAPIDYTVRGLTIASEPPAIDRLIDQCLAHITSGNTRRAYARHIKLFAASGRQLTRSGVGQYLGDQRLLGATAATNRQAVAAIRLLAREAEMRRLLDPIELLGIERIKPETLRGHKLGRWLSKADVLRLLALPDRQSLSGVRDAALLAVMAGCGLRREEVCSLIWRQYTERDGRMVIMDLLGKGCKYRNVPVADWVAARLDKWHAAVAVHGQDAPACKIFQSVGRSAGFTGTLTPDGIYSILAGYSLKLGVPFAPHDLRRTFAKLLQQSGADIQQIMYLLGHSSIATTQIYLGSAVELRPGMAAVDKLEMDEDD